MPVVVLLALGLLLAAGAFVAAELAARWWIRARAFHAVYPPGSRQRLELDRATHPTLEPVVTYSINKEGERGPEVPADGRGLYRVLVTGGSAAEGFLTDQESCWPSVLRRRLSTPGMLSRLGRRAVHVGTIGRSGFDAAALELTHERILPRYPYLDAIVVYAGAGDIMRWLAAQAPDSGSAWESTVRETFAQHPEHRFGWTPRSLALAELYRRLRARRVVEVRHHAARWMGRARLARVQAYRDGTLLESTPDPEIMVGRYGEHLHRALVLARRHAARVVVVLQPLLIKPVLSDEERAHLWNGGTGQAYREDIATFYSDAVIGRLMEAITQRTRDVAAAAGAEVVDPAPSLDIGLRHFFDHVHQNAAGAAVVAGVVADHLVNGHGAPTAAAAPMRADARPLAVTG